MWNQLIGGASILAITSFVVKILIQRFIEKSIDRQFDMKMEKYKNDLMEKLEYEKTELSVWFELRKDILTEKWACHKTILEKMSTTIFALQDIIFKKGDKQKFEESIDSYRIAIHGTLDLISNEAIDICQEFLEMSYKILSKKSESKSDIPLKEIRQKFREYSFESFGIDKMMPKMINRKNV